MKIVDCFTFYNELDMLEYRLAAMNDVVDHFVLVEATHTHAGKEKPLYYEENKQRYAKWSDKIVHVVVRDMPFVYPNINYEANEQWQNENYQRNAIQRGFNTISFSDEDVLMISDLDEIVDPNLLRRIRSGEQTIYYHGVQMDVYVYNLHSYFEIVQWIAARILTWKAYRELGRNPQTLRVNTYRDLNVIWGCNGWHLTYFGDDSFIKNKLMNFGHQELNNPKFTDDIVIRRKMESGIAPCDEVTKARYVNVPGERPLPPLYETYLRKFYSSP
jgi:beta-1,4-mannosyl-glycoprotein beta-1,4-N-acetylglucosaminyltransferase